MNNTPRISVIIPVLNEAELLPQTLKCVEANSLEKEILIVDAGSTDETVKFAKGNGRRLIESPVRQRASQMNLGAAQATSEILLFLHADTLLPEGALESIVSALRNPKIVGGAFNRRYCHPSVFLKVTCYLARTRSRFLGWNLGDQGVFVRKSAFQTIGGFPDRNLFEDLEFSRQLNKLGQTINLKPHVLSSGRRFGKHPIRRTVRDFILTCHYFANRK